MGAQARHQLAETREVTPATGSAIRWSIVPVERFDEYLLVARVGQGGMAEVFLGLSEGPVGFRKLVAIKRLHRHLQEDPEAVGMFVNEANMAARLQHPNIVQTNRAGRFEGQHFIAMEYLDGQPLHRLLGRLRAQEGRLAPALAVRLALDALDGLHYAHEARDYTGMDLSLIHRDVSPHNLFVTLDGHVKLIDFGIAKLGSLPSHTRAGLIKGKLSYMAPEQALGESLDRRADIWSMGVTLRECLSGQRLFRGVGDLEVLRATISEEIVPLHEAAPHVPAELAAIVDRALQRDRTLRFSTALEFKEALEYWLSSQNAGDSRTTISAMMRVLFSDVIEQRRATLCECLSRVDASASSSTTVAFTQDTKLNAAQPNYRGPRPSDPLLIPSSSKFLRKLATVLGAVTLAVLLGLVSGNAPYGRLTTRAIEKGDGSSTLDQGHKLSAPIAEAPSLSPEQAKPTLGAAQKPSPSSVDSAGGSPTPLGISSSRTMTRSSGNRRFQHERGVALDAEPVSPDPMPADEPVPVPEPRHTGRLILDSTPYAIVSLGEQRLGITPIDVELSATTHTLILRNPELGIETTYRVAVPPHGSINRRVALD